MSRRVFDFESAIVRTPAPNVIDGLRAGGEAPGYQGVLAEHEADVAALEAAGVAVEVLVLDNASQDGSVGAARAHATVDDVIVNDRRRGKAENDTQLLQRARGTFALLLNEDSELRGGASAALLAALKADDRAGAAGARLLRPDGVPQASAWRFPTAAFYI